MGRIAPPIVVVEGSDVILHPSLEAAERWLEPWWVRGSEGIVYDAVGNQLEAVVTEGEKVRLTETEPTIHAPAELRAALVSYLRKSKGQEDAFLDSSSLDALIRLCSTPRKRKKY
jgi:hypothetical protein